MFRLKILFIFLFIVNILNAKESNLEKISLQLQWKHQFEYAGFYMAKEKGFYKDVNLDVEIKEFNFSINVTDEVINGNSTYGVNYPSIILDRSNDKQIILLAAILQSSPHALISLKSSNIKSIKDFENKRIMIGTDARKTATFKAMLKSENLDFSKMKIIPKSFDINDLVKKKTELISVYISNEPFKLDNKNVEYDIWLPKNYGFDLYEDLLFTSQEELERNPKRVSDFTKASLKGWQYAFDNIDETIEIILKKYNTQNKTRRALQYEANILKELAFANNKEIGSIDKSKVQRILDLYSLMGLSTNELNMHDFVYDINQKDLQLSKEEKKFLKDNPNIYICVNPDMMPFEKIEDKKHIGISSDYIKLFKEKLNVNFELVQTKSWQESKETLAKCICDIIPFSTSFNELKQDMKISSPYIKETLVLATKLDNKFINSIDELRGKKIGIAKAYNLKEKLLKKYPWLDLLETQDISSGLKMVSKGELYGQIDAISIINYHISEQYWGDLKVSGRFEEYLELGIAANKNRTTLNLIFEKLVHSISQEEKNKIFNKWNKPKEIVEEINYTIIFQIIFIFVLAILAILYRQYVLKVNNKKLKNIIDGKTKELKQLNQKLELQVLDRTSKLNDFISATTDFIWEVDNKGRYTFVSNGVKDILAYEANEILGKTPFEFMENAQRHKILVNIFSLMKNHSNIENLESWNISKDGQKVCLLTNAIAIFNEENKFMGYRGTNKDITLQKNIQKELKNKELILLEQSKLASMGEMLESIAHQWRQPLSVITTAASGTKIQKELNILSDDFLNTNLDLIIKSAKHLSTTIDDFRTFYKKDKKAKHFNLKKAVFNSIDLVSSKLHNRDIELITELSDITVLGFENELIQVFLNIINNAIDILEESNKDEKILKIESSIEDKKILLHFIDNGGGIDTNVISKVFNHKFTTKAHKNGTGIGLYMSKLIVDKSKGELEASNKRFIYNGNSYMGACFTISLKVS